MISLRPHKQFNFVGMWKYGFILSSILIVLSIAGFVASGITTGFPLTLGTEFSGGTSIQITNSADLTVEQISEAFSTAASELSIDSQVSSIQTSVSGGTNGFIIKTTDTDSNAVKSIMNSVESQLSINADDVQVETIGASWGASVVWSSIMAFLVSCIAILIVIALRYREPKMGVVALITLFHDMIIVLGIYAWAGMFIHMEITADVIAALLAIVGYSLYDTIVVFHRIDENASPQMKMSLKTCANISINQIIVRSMNTSITSIIPVFFMLILGTGTLLDFAFAMFCGMILGIYSTLAISSPIFTLWKCKNPDYARLEKKYPYVVEQWKFTKPMLIEARKQSIADEKKAKKEAKSLKAEAKKEQAAQHAEAKKAKAEAARHVKDDKRHKEKAEKDKRQKTQDADKKSSEQPDEIDEPDEAKSSEQPES